MKQFDYNKYLKNNPLLKEDAPPKAVPPPPPGGPKNAPPRAATPPKTGTPPPAISASKITQKASKFVGDNKMFVDKMKATIGTDSKILAGIMVSIANTIIRDKKLPSNPNMNKAIQYLNSTAGEKTTSTPPPPPGKSKQEIPKAPPPPPPSVKEDVNEESVRMFKSDNPEGDQLVLSFLKGIAKKYDYPLAQAVLFVKERIKKLGY